MDYIRKNWSRLSLALLYFVGGVIAVIAWINNSGHVADKDWLNALYNTIVVIATVLYFFGMVGVTIMKTMQNSKKIVSILYMTIGALISVMMLVLICIASSNQADLILIYGDGAITAFYQLYVPFIVFGLHALIKGVTRFIEAEGIPAKAAVQPVAPVANEVVAEEKAPKAPAKKTAPKAPAAK